MLLQKLQPRDKSSNYHPITFLRCFNCGKRAIQLCPFCHRIGFCSVECLTITLEKSEKHTCETKY